MVAVLIFTLIALSNVISIATPIIRDGIRIIFYFIKLNLFFASQVNRKNKIFNLKKRKTKVYFGEIQTGKKK